MKSMNRRELLRLAGLSAVVATPITHFIPELMNSGRESKKTDRPETILSGFRDGAPYVAKNSGLRISVNGSSQTIKLANEIHSILRSERLDINAFIPKLELMAYIQVSEGLLQSFQAAPGNYFYGHAAIDEKRGLLYTAQARITKDRDGNARTNEPGFVFVHSLPDLKELGKFDSFGFDPHDMLVNGDTLLVCNGGTNTNVALIDLETKRLIKRFELSGPDRDLDLSLRHIDKVDDKNYVVASLSTRSESTDAVSPLYGLNVDRGFQRYLSQPFVDQTLLQFQILSVKYHDGYVYGSCPATDSLIVWKYNGSFIGGASIPSASNICYSERHDGMIIGSGADDEPARLIRIVNDKVILSKLEELKNLTGAHSLILS